VTKAALVLVLACVTAPHAAVAGDPRGTWWVEGGAARVEIDDCEDALCGRVVWLRSPFDLDGCPLRDVQNPVHELREREVNGLVVLRDLRAAAREADVWRGGSIYDPGSGRTYRVVLRLSGPDRIEVRGYVGFELLGRTTTWLRVGAEGICSEAPGSS